MNEFQWNHLLIKFNEHFFSAYGDGMAFYNEVPLTETPWNDEHESILKEIRSRLKSHKALEAKKSNEAINSLGQDVGRKSYRFDLDNRLFFLMKEKNVVISKFINEAIREKLERN